MRKKRGTTTWREGQIRRQTRASFNTGRILPLTDWSSGLSVACLGKEGGRGKQVHEEKRREFSESCESRRHPWLRVSLSMTAPPPVQCIRKEDASFHPSWPSSPLFSSSAVAKGGETKEFQAWTVNEISCSDTRSPDRLYECMHRDGCESLCIMICFGCFMSINPPVRLTKEKTVCMFLSASFFSLQSRWDK